MPLPEELMLTMNCTNIVKAIHYDGDNVSTECIDSEGVGYLSYCLDNDISLMGFCRRAQMLVVVSGATIIQDIPTWFAQQGVDYNYEHRREKGEGEIYRDYVPHSVTLPEGSKLSEFYNTTTLTNCPSWHHQTILGTEGTPLRVAATATVAGVEMVEGIERTDKTCALAVQFHPEAAVVKHLGKAVNNDNAG